MRRPNRGSGGEVSETTCRGSGSETGSERVVTALIGETP